MCTNYGREPDMARITLPRTNNETVIAKLREKDFTLHYRPKLPINSQTADAALKGIDYSGKLVTYGLHSIVSTSLDETGFSPDVIEGALAYSDKN